MLSVQVPEDAFPGQLVHFPTTDGGVVEVLIPQGVSPGSLVQVSVPVTVEMAASNPFSDPPKLVVQPIPTRSAFDSTCIQRCATFCLCYCLVVGIFAVIAVFGGAAGLVLLSLAPALVIGRFMETWYGKHITRCTIVDVFLEATAILLIPLMIAISIIVSSSPNRNLVSLWTSQPWTSQPQYRFGCTGPPPSHDRELWSYERGRSLLAVCEAVGALARVVLFSFASRCLVSPAAISSKPL